MAEWTSMDDAALKQFFADGGRVYCDDCAHCLPAPRHRGTSQMEFARCAVTPSPDASNSNLHMRGGGGAYCGLTNRDGACSRFERKPAGSSRRESAAYPWVAFGIGLVAVALLWRLL